MSATDAALRTFRRDTERHELTIMQDDGLHRHLRFRNPERGMYWFDLITWPGALCINSDYGTWVFARLADMFEFFRSPRGHINASYWAEKLLANDRFGTEVYDENLFKENVIETFWGDREYLVDSDGKPNASAVWAEIRRDILGEWVDWHYEECARNALADFDRYRQHKLFEDSWEWKLTSYSHQFLWALHAIVDGIARYDEAKAVAA